MCAGSRFPPCSSFCVIRNMRRSVWKGISMAKAKSTGFFCRNAVMNLPNGWGSARRARRGIRWWSAVRTGIIRYGSRAVCGSGFADGGTGKRAGAQAKPVSLDEIELSDTDRTRTGFAELDRVLGSGVVRGSWCWSAEIRESENQPCFCRSAGTWQDRNKRFYTSPARSH